MPHAASNAPKKLYAIIAVTSFVWAILVLIWILNGTPPSKMILDWISQHPWVIMAAVVAFMAVFWTWFWIRAQRQKVPRSLMALKMFSDALLVALIGGVLIWNWPSTALVIIGSALVLSYAARSLNSVIRLSRRQ